MSEPDPENVQLFRDIEAYLKREAQTASAETRSQVLIQETSPEVPVSLKAPAVPSRLLNNYDKRELALKAILIGGFIASGIEMGIGIFGILSNPEPISSRLYSIIPLCAAEAVITGVGLWKVFCRPGNRGV